MKKIRCVIKGYSIKFPEVIFFINNLTCSVDLIFIIKKNQNSDYDYNNIKIFESKSLAKEYLISIRRLMKIHKESDVIWNIYTQDEKNSHLNLRKKLNGKISNGENKSKLSKYLDGLI